MLSARILATGNYHQPFGEDDELPALGPAMKAVCRQRYRRIDRFIQLALIGSGRCAAVRAPQRNCGVYIGSGIGPLPSNIKAQNMLFRDRELPTPFAFVNTLGSSAGFYVADNLGLDASALVVSGHQNSLGAALTSALLDLAAGHIDQALVGTIEVMALPLADQRMRLGVAADRQLAEGSHWWLLGRDTPDGNAPRLRLQPRVDMATLPDILSDRPQTPTGLGRSVDAAATAVVRQWRHNVQTTDSLAYHNSIEAAWLAQRDGDCMLVTGSGTVGLNVLDRLG